MAVGLTPFGARIRELRRQQAVSQKQMAADLQIPSAFPSALALGRLAPPPPRAVAQVSRRLSNIWDEADAMRRLAKLSHPRVVIDTAQTGPEATELANRLAEGINDLAVAKVKQMLAVMAADN